MTKYLQGDMAHGLLFHSVAGNLVDSGITSVSIVELIRARFGFKCPLERERKGRDRDEPVYHRLLSSFGFIQKIRLWDATRCRFEPPPAEPDLAVSPGSVGLPSCITHRQMGSM